MDYEILENLYYTKSHEWARLDGNVVTVGITSYAVEQMDKEIVNIELPEKGGKLEKGQTFGVVDSVKAAFDLYTPVGGELIDVNSLLTDQPELVANSPYGEGWMIKIAMSDPQDLGSLMNAQQYKAFLASEE